MLLHQPASACITIAAALLCAQEEVLSETVMMIPDTRARLERGIEELTEYLVRTLHLAHSRIRSPSARRWPHRAAAAATIRRGQRQMGSVVLPFLQPAASSPLESPMLQRAG